MSAMWKKWFWSTAAFGVELYALHDCGLGCLVGHPSTTVQGWTVSHLATTSCQPSWTALVEETARALKPKLVVVRRWLAPRLVCEFFLSSAWG